MPTCNTCDTFVTPSFVRVFGTNDGEAFACPYCASMRAVADGAATDPDRTVQASSDH